MSVTDNDIQLLAAIKDESMSGVTAALEAGANVNGPPEGPFPPVVAATLVGHVVMVEVLLKRGADPDRPVGVEISDPSSDMVIASPGERALHVAARIGEVEIVRLLLERSRADPNVSDNRGRTPLVAICEIRHSCGVCGEVVPLLLEAGADPAVAEELGFVPLHAVALHGNTNLVDMLYSGAPAMLNRYSSTGETPLLLACLYGHESTVSKLLSLGAMQRMPPHASDACPLSKAIESGSVGVVRVLMNEGGIKAVGGKMASLPKALYFAVSFRQPRILRLLLAVDGEERRSKWANKPFLCRRFLHVGAGFCFPAAVSILLEAGADEAAYDLQGRIPRDVIGLYLAQDVQMDEGEGVAIRRMLQRGPAYRARSWAWPSDEEADAGGSGDGDTAAAAAADDDAVLSSPPTVKTSPVIGVRIFRPKEKTSSGFFVRLIGRYCAKD